MSVCRAKNPLFFAQFQPNFQELLELCLEMFKTLSEDPLLTVDLFFTVYVLLLLF